jgi:hypothetical protein
VPSVAAQDEIQRVEVAEAGVALALPAAWTVDIEMREREDWGLSDRFEDAAPTAFLERAQCQRWWPAAALVVLYTEAGDGDWCLLKVHENNPLTLDEAAGGC